MGWRFVSSWRSEIQQPEAFIQSCFFFFWSVSQAHCFHTSRITLKFPEGKSKHGQIFIVIQLTFSWMEGNPTQVTSIYDFNFFGKNIRVGPYSKTNATMQWYNMDVPCLQMFNLYFYTSWTGLLDRLLKTPGGSGVPVQWHGKLWHCNSWKLIPRWEVWGVKIWWRTKIWGRSMEI